MPHPFIILFLFIATFLIGFKIFSETWLKEKELEIKKDGKRLEIILFPHGSWILGVFSLLLSIPFIYLSNLLFRIFPFEKMMHADSDWWVYGLFIFIAYGMVRNAWNFLAVLPKLFTKAQILKIEEKEIKLISKGFFKTTEEKLLISNIEKFAVPYFNEYQKTDSIFKYLFHSGLIFFVNNKKKKVLGLWFVHLKFLLEVVDILKSRGLVFDGSHEFE